MKVCSEFVLMQKVTAMAPLQGSLLKYFNRILIFDSTSWDIRDIEISIIPF